MEVSKTALAVALSTGLLFGCDFDVGPDSGSDSGGGSDPTTPTSEIVGPLWNFEDASGASAQAIGLPNVYVFDGTYLKYYDDDASINTYEIKITPYTDDAEAGEITFTYYDDAGVGSEVSGTYTVDNGELTIDTASEGILIGADDTSNADIKAAVEAANAEAGLNNQVHILDTKTDDTGELRLKLSEQSLVDSIQSGRLTVDLVYQVDEDTEQAADGTSDNAYVSFYASETKKDFLHGEVAFEDGNIKYRDSAGSLTETGETFELGKTMELEVTWDASGFSFSIDGTEIGSNLPVADSSEVTYIALRLGATTDTTNFELYGDNLKVYSNDDGSEELVFQDNFDNYTVGKDLSAGPYDSNGSEAVVFSTTGPVDPVDPVDPPTPGDVTDDFEAYTAGVLISDASGDWLTYNIKTDEYDGEVLLGSTKAEVSDAKSNGGNNSLMLADLHSTTKPYAAREFAAASTAGEVSIDAYFPSTNTKSTYINVGVGKNNDERYFELNQSGTQLKYEAGSTDVKIADIVQDQWYTVTLAWTAEGKFTVSLDGIAVATDIDQSGTGLDSTNIPTQLTLYTGDNSSIVNTAYFDNLDSDLF